MPKFKVIAPVEASQQIDETLLCMIFSALSYASTVYDVIVCLFVRPSVCHKSEFYQDG